MLSSLDLIKEYVSSLHYKVLSIIYISYCFRTGGKTILARRTHDINRNFNVAIFLMSYFAFMIIRVFLYFFVVYLGAPESTLNLYSSAMFFGAILLITYTMPKAKVFYHRGIYILLTGITLWLGWGIFTMQMGLTLGGPVARRELLALTIFTITLFLGTRIIIYYDLRVEVVRITVFFLGTHLVINYIQHFDNFGAFRLTYLMNILNAGGRYRTTYGLGHVNNAGVVCMYFFIFKALYKALLLEKGKRKYRSDVVYKYLSVIQIIILIMLISTGSRASITGSIALFFGYYTLKNYQKFKHYSRILVVMLAFWVVFFVISAVDWNMVYMLSGRAGNYQVFPALTRRDAWLTGLGFFTYSPVMAALTGTGVIDSFYVFTFLQSGIIGSLFLFGSMIWSLILYFHDIGHMTNLQIMSVMLLGAFIYHGIFEAFGLYGHGPYTFLAWCIYISCLNEKSPKYQRVVAHRMPVSVLHNS